MLYSHLSDVPLPAIIYNGPLDSHIVPLVRAVRAFDLTTTGSCAGHLDRFFPYPWVQIVAYENVELLEVLVKAYNKRGNEVTWQGGSLVRTMHEARNLSELARLQKGIEDFSEFLFEHRPEVLDSEYNASSIKMPDLESVEYKRLMGLIENTFDELNRLSEQLKTNSSDSLSEIAYQTAIKKLIEMYKEMDKLPGECYRLPVTKDVRKRLLQKATEVV